MVCAVGTFHYRRVTHHLLRAYLRLEEGAGNTVPMYAVAAIDEAQSFVGGFMKRGRNENVRRHACPWDKHHGSGC